MNRGAWAMLVAMAFLVAAAAGAARADDFVGASTCLGCHSGLEPFNRNIHAKGMANAKGIEFEKSCETCHGAGGKHAAAGGDKSDPGFATIKNPSKLKPVEASAVCLQCHESGERMHWKGSTHDMKNVSCVNCHGMHADKVNGGKAPLLKKASGAESCYQCHAEKKAQIRKSAHMPLVEGKMGCTGCHNPHGSPAEKMLVRSNVVETCYTCHQDKRGPFMWDHAPARESCTPCHDPHGSHNEKMLVQRAPLLCQRCHVGGRHPATAYGNTASDLASSRQAYKGCINCHQKVHGSNHPSGKYLER
ncbi:MAG: DmsE family decaheme c-type cytochrome [Elusimicrobia bacterium]|nr:DmsE family decaheme c-type cytochrome [Elusimicrobiota bacterium]